MENWITYLLLIGVVLSGGLLVFFLKEKITGSLKFLLAFSGAFMLGIAALHLISICRASNLHWNICITRIFDSINS
jgi:hypothetical protein